MDRLKTIILACFAALTLAGCVDTWNPNYGRQENIFLEQGGQRYGHGGTQSPSGRASSYGHQSQEPSPFWRGGRRRKAPDRTGGTQFLEPEKKRNPRPPVETVDERSYAVVEPTETVNTTAPEETVVREDPPVVESESKPEKAPYATPVVNKPGYVTSPFDTQKRYVDVSGIPPGTEVECPYTGKIFRVP